MTLGASPLLGRRRSPCSGSTSQPPDPYPYRPRRRLCFVIRKPGRALPGSRLAFPPVVSRRRRPPPPGAAGRIKGARSALPLATWLPHNQVAAFSSRLAQVSERIDRGPVEAHLA